MRVSILKGVYVGTAGYIRSYYPMNLLPVIGDNGISEGFLRTEPGLTLYGTGPGADRGSIIWNGVQYRVMGSKLVRIDGSGVITTLGDVGSDGNPVTLDYGFDRLAIASNGHLFYWNGTTLTQVTDVNLGTVLDVSWIDGYYMTTDGTSLVVTNLSDPTTVNPLKYGSAEADPDPIVAVKRVRDEIYAIGAYTIQNYQNIGGSGFPFQNNPGGLIPKGAVGTKAVCYYLDTLAFVGSGRQEEPSIYLAGYGTTENIGTTETDFQIGLLTLAQRAAIEVESMTYRNEQRLYVHLPTVTLVYHRQASLKAQKPVWTQLAGGVNMDQAYPARHFSYSGYGWLAGSTTGQVGSIDDSVATHFGSAATAQFETAFLYNQGQSAILKSVELMGTPGVSAAGPAPLAYLSWSHDGHAWSPEQTASIGSSGQYQQRIQWRPKTRLRNVMGLKVRLPSPGLASFAALEIQAEPLNA